MTAFQAFGQLLLQGEAQTSSLKVYLCGNPKTGKTTLGRSLKLQPHPTPAANSDTERTRGIEVSHTTIQGAKYVLWDFAGQVDYHVSHNLFMYPEAAVFLVLVDVRLSREERLKQCTYWLRYICTQCPPNERPSVLVLGTHVDKAEVIDNDSMALMFYELHEMFSSSVKFVTDAVIMIDTREHKSTSMLQLQSLLDQTRMAMVASGQAITPLACKVIIDTVESARQHNNELRLLSMAEFVALCKPAILSSFSTNKLDTSDTYITETIQLAILHLHRIGSLFHDPSSPLKDLVIVDLAWLCHNVLGWVFCPDNMVRENDQLTPLARGRWLAFNKVAKLGPVPLSAIPLAPADVTQQCDALEALEHFKLCCKLEQCGQVQYVFPSLLGPMRPDMWKTEAVYDYHVGVELRCVKLTTSIPVGIFTQLQATLFNAMGGTVNIWQDGIIYSPNGDAQACVTLENDFTIRIHARGPMMNTTAVLTCLHEIVTFISDLMASAPGLSFAVHFLSPAALATYSVDATPAYTITSVIAHRTRGDGNIRSTSGRAATERVAVVAGVQMLVYIYQGSFYALERVSIGDELARLLDGTPSEVAKLLTLLEADRMRDHSLS